MNLLRTVALLLLALLLALAPVGDALARSAVNRVSAQTVSSNHVGTTNVATVAFTDNEAQESPLSTFTFPDMAIGAVAGGRHVLVAISGRSGNTSTNITSVTIGGITATSVIRAFRGGSGSGENLTAIYIAPVPTGTTATIVVNFNVAFARASVSVYRVVGLMSATATATGNSTATNPTASLNISAGGFAVGSCYSESMTSFTWTNLTESVDSTTNFNNTYTAAAANFAAAQTGLALTCTPASSLAPAGVFAAFK